jgi:hypothetical protein
MNVILARGTVYVITLLPFKQPTVVGMWDELSHGTNSPPVAIVLFGSSINPKTASIHHAVLLV